MAEVPTPKQFTALQRRLQDSRDQLAESVSVPMSEATSSGRNASGHASVQGNNEIVMDVLLALELDWGDFDPSRLLRQLKRDSSLKKAFIAADTLQVGDAHGPDKPQLLLAQSCYIRSWIPSSPVNERKIPKKETSPTILQASTIESQLVFQAEKAAYAHCSTCSIPSSQLQFDPVRLDRHITYPCTLR